MGMAAGQARLLSITARMSDNELRAQIINNNKMRLATKSSQVSEAYIQALNDAQLMFSNYDANNNATYQQLTFNALTAYNPYNNQYALSNASGNVLLSELDARNYESVRKFGNSEDRLAAFLKCYGLEYTTNYFDETLSKSGCYGNSDENGDMEKSDFVYLPLYNSDGTLELGKVNNDYYSLRANTGFKVKELQKMYEGGTVKDDLNLKLKSDGYINIIQSEAYYNYQSALNDYSIKKEDYEAFVTVAKEAKLDELVENLSITDSETTIKTMDDLISQIEGIEVYTSTSTGESPSPATTNDVFYKTTTTLLSDFVQDYQSLMTSTETTTWLSNLTTELKNNCGPTLTETIPAGEYVYANTDANGEGEWYIMSKEIGEDGSTYAPFARVIPYAFGPTLIVLVDGHDEVEITTEEGTTTQTCTNPIYIQPDVNNSLQHWTSGVVTPDTSICTSGETIQVYWGQENDTSVEATPMYTWTSISSTGETVPANTDSEILYNMPNDQPNEQTALIAFLEELRDSIYTKWDSKNFQGSPHDNAVQGTNAWCENELHTKYTAYKDAAIKLGKVIYGDTYTGSVNDPLPIDKLGDFLNNAYYKEDTDKELALKTDTGGKIYEKTGAESTWASVSEGFRQVLQVLILDEVMNTYGEPKFAYIDEANPNENGDAKAQWYTNLFNRIEDGGYRTLKDGLASSPEWIKFAFESGIITLEQVDDKYTWNKMIYTNSADITEQTDSVAVAKAEAEYNAAMNKIENKDKRYDMELKNIDTEHNSLQTEYESIKTAIDKNIERTFKLYS